MMVFRLIFSLLLLIPASWTDIGKKNRAIKEAARSYAETDYEQSVERHLALSTDFGINTPTSNFNLALSYHYNGQLEEAQRTYQQLQSTDNKLIASFAANQNGILLAQQNQFEEALSAFKFSLIKDPTNEQARYNYELLSRWLEENPDRQEQQDDQGEDQDQQDDQQDQDQDQDQDKQSQEKKDGEGDEKTDEDEASESEKKDDKSGEKSQQEEPSDEPSDLESDLSEREKAMERMKEKLEEMNLTPEQAAQILEAMNAAELRYIQQNRKKPTKRPERGLPEW
ncbi:hypothetical protein [Cecembia lonarensis]|nr:hypothetical protein [Cecembia lonarensis]